MLSTASPASLRSRSGVINRLCCAKRSSVQIRGTLKTMKISISRESIYWLTIVALSLVIGFSQYAHAWTAPGGSPPAGNVAGPLTVGSVSQTKAGDLGAQRLCLPGSNPSGGCISTWPSGGVTGSGTTGKIPKFTGASALGDSIMSSAYSSFLGSDAIKLEYGALEVRGYGGTGGMVWADNYIAAPIYCSLPGCTYYMAPQATSVMNIIYANAFYYSSDESIKKNIKTIPNALENVLKLRGVEFNWKRDGRADIGVIAQEVEKVFPQLVSTNKTTGLKSVEYSNLVGPLIEAVKEQQKEIEEMRKEIEELKR